MHYGTNAHGFVTALQFKTLVIAGIQSSVLSVVPDNRVYYSKDTNKCVCEKRKVSAHNTAIHVLFVDGFVLVNTCLVSTKPLRIRGVSCNLLRNESVCICSLSTYNWVADFLCCSTLQVCWLKNFHGSEWVSIDKLVKLCNAMLDLGRSFIVC